MGETTLFIVYSSSLTEGIFSCSQLGLRLLSRFTFHVTFLVSSRSYRCVTIVASVVCILQIHFEYFSSFQRYLICGYSFPDVEVRKTAVKWMESFSDDEVVDFLPQLIQALKHETFETSALAQFLLKRALSSPRVAHFLFWLLIQLLPTQILHVRVFQFIIELYFLVFLIVR